MSEEWEGVGSKLGAVVALYVSARSRQQLLTKLSCVSVCVCVYAAHSCVRPPRKLNKSCRRFSFIDKTSTAS